MTTESSKPQGQRMYVRPNKPLSDMSEEEIEKFARSLAQRVLAQMKSVDEDEVPSN